MSNTKTQKIESRVPLINRAQVSVPPSHQRIDPLVEHRSFITSLNSGLKRTLPFFSIDHRTKNNDRRIRVYVKSVDRLLQMQHQAESFLLKLCIYHIKPVIDLRYTNHPAVSGDAANLRLEMAQDLLERAPEFNLGPPLRLKADVLSLPIPELHQRMQSALQGRLDSMLEVFFRALQGLADAQVLGQITAHTGDACDFHYYHSVFRVEVANSVEESREISSQRHGRGVLAVLKSVCETRTTYHLIYTFSHARHELTIYRPRTYPAPAPTVPKPDESLKLLSGVPSWLMPHLRVVEGDQVDGRIIEKELAKKSRKYTLTKHDTYVTRIHFDPCITLGSLVLAGWTVHDLGGPKHYARLHRRAELAHALRFTGLPLLARLAGSLRRISPERRHASRPHRF